MSNKKVWFITGAGRGMGADFAKAALAVGHAVVATGRNSDAVSKVLGHSNDLLAVQLDVTNAPTPMPRSAPLSTDSAASTCWSTMPPAFTRATSRN